jgi:hypothetical protein
MLYGPRESKLGQSRQAYNIRVHFLVKRSQLRLCILDNTVRRRSSAGANSPLYLMAAPVLGK